MCHHCSACTLFSGKQVRCGPTLHGGRRGGGGVQQLQQHELSKSIVVCNDTNAWDPEKTNGCSSAAAAAAATAMSGEMLMAAFCQC